MTKPVLFNYVDSKEKNTYILNLLSKQTCKTINQTTEPGGKKMKKTLNIYPIKLNNPWG